jgi:nucleotide-binding universal stress UspA family protein
MKKILVLTDFSKKSEHAAEIALKIARKAGADVVLYHLHTQPVLVPETTLTSTFMEEEQHFSEDEKQKLTKFCENIKKKTVESQSLHIPDIKCISESGLIDQSLEEKLKKLKNIWFIVIGEKDRHANIFDRFIVGSDALDILRHATKPVLVIPEHCQFKAVRYIALATNFEKDDYRALKMLVDFAGIFEAEITLVHVCKDKLSIEEKLKNVARFHRLKAKLNTDKIDYEDVQGTEIASALLKFTSAQKIDLLSVVHKKHSLIDKLLHSSTTIDLMDTHRLPLLIFPATSII